MKRILTLLATGIALLATPAMADCDDGEIVIRFQHDSPARNHPKGEAARFLSELVNGEMQGRACMIVTANAPVLDVNIVEDLATGKFEMGAPNIGALGEVSPRFLIFDLPFLFKDFSAVFAFVDDPTGQSLLTQASDQGLLGLSYWLDGMKAFSANTPLNDPSDMAGLKFGVEDALLEVDYITNLAAEPVRMPVSDLSAALQSGSVDGQNTTWTNISTRGLYQYQHSVTETNHGVTLYMLVADPAFWDGLPADVRADLELFIAIASQERNRFAFELAELSKMNIRSDGTPIRILDADSRIEWVRAMQPTWFEYGGQIGFDQIGTALSIERRIQDGTLIGFE